MLVLGLAFCHSLPYKLEQGVYMPSRHQAWPNIARYEYRLAELSFCCSDVLFTERVVYLCCILRHSFLCFYADTDCGASL